MHKKLPFLVKMTRIEDEEESVETGWCDFSTDNSSDFGEHDSASNSSSVFTLETDDISDLCLDHEIELDANLLMKLALNEVAERMIYSTRNSPVLALVYELFEIYANLFTNKRVSVNRSFSISEIFQSWKVLLNPNTSNWLRCETEKKLFQNRDNL